MSGYFEKNVVVGPFQCNCRILLCPKTGEAAIIDAGDEADRIVSAVESMEWKDPSGAALKPRVKWLLHTHAHLDHIGATRGVSERYGKTPVIAVHRGDAPIYEKLREQGALFGLSYDEPLPIGHFIEHEEEIRVGSLRLSVIHVPGHSPGSVGFRMHEDAALGVPETVFSGDTLFQGSVGRTDLWGADGDLMFKMIRERLLTLDGDTRVCPGHGPETRMGVEKRENPFL